MSLSERLRLDDSELVAFVGGGGKSTLLAELGEELAAQGATVVLTTTTKMSSEQARQAPLLVVTEDPIDVSNALAEGNRVTVIHTDDGRKVTGPSPNAVDEIFVGSGADYVLVEADGARRKPFKTPAEHEPVVPARATLVVVVMGFDAIGHPIRESCHRPGRVAELAGLTPDDVLDVPAAAAVVHHEQGVLGSIPENARVAVVITKVEAADDAQAQYLAAAIGSHPRIERTLVIRRHES